MEQFLKYIYFLNHYEKEIQLSSKTYKLSVESFQWNNYDIVINETN